MRYSFFFLLCILIIVPVTGRAQEFVIAAVVNDNVITNQQLQDRITLAIKFSGLPNTQNTRAGIARQILESLIDESLQLEEANRQKISLTDEEVNRSLEKFAQQNKVELSSLDDFIKKSQLPKKPFYDQIRAQLLWQKVALTSLRSRIFITKEEVADFAQRVSAKAAKEVKLSEILLSVEQPDQENDSKKLARELVEQLRAGSNFSSIAKQFSRSPSSENGGDLGWLSESDLGPEIQVKLSLMQPGDVSDAIRTSAGYVILKVEDQRLLEDKQAASPDEAKIRDFLSLKKLDLEARRYMKNLRRAAYIERRI